MVGWWLLKKPFQMKSATNGDVEGNPTKVVNDVPVAEVLYDIENYCMRILKQWVSQCSLLVLDWLLSIASPLRFVLARKIWRQILEGFFGAIFHVNNERSKSHSSFVISF